MPFFFFQVSLCNSQPDGSNALRIMGTPGKSGSLFFFSNDMKFIVKTLPKREAKLLLEILPNYFQVSIFFLFFFYLSIFF